MFALVVTREVIYGDAGRPTYGQSPMSARYCPTGWRTVSLKFGKTGDVVCSPCLLHRVGAE